jgi:hypothetical protein
MASRAAQIMTEGADEDTVAPPAGAQATSPYQNTVADLQPGPEDVADEFVAYEPEPTEERLDQDAGNQPLIQPQTQQRQPGQRHTPDDRYRSRSHRTEVRNRAIERDRTTISRLEVENAELRRRLDNTDARLTEFDGARHQETLDRFDRDIAAASQQYKDATQRFTIAARAIGQGEDGAEEAMRLALEDRDNAVMRRSQLTVQRNMLATGNPAGEANLSGDGRQQVQQRQDPRQQQVQQAPPMRPEVQSRVNVFMRDNPWWDPNGGDLDSQIMLLLDRQVSAEGFLPNTDDYWDELRDRAAERLPHRFQDDGQGRQQQHDPRMNGNVQQLRPQQQAQQQPPMRRGPATGGAAEGGAPRGNGTQVLLTAGRKEELVNMGVLARDGRTIMDKPKYQRLLRSYDTYDREHPGEAQ